MTVPSDLLEAHGKHRCLYCKIEGFEPMLWQRSQYGVPVGGTWSRSHKVCLRAPTELSTDIDLVKMDAGLSAITIELDDIEDSDGKSYFAKHFAPARWSTGRTLTVAHGTAGRTVLDADATTISTMSTQGWAASGTGYIGSEAFTWDSLGAGNELNGVTKGIYPAVGPANRGYTYECPVAGEKGENVTISQYPFTFMGKQIALYIHTWDEATGTWYGNDEQYSQLLWCGRISDQISFDPRTKGWKLSCTSVYEDLDKTIADNMLSSKLKGYNFSGQGGGNGVYFTIGVQGTFEYYLLDFSGDYFPTVDGFIQSFVSKYSAIFAQTPRIQMNFVRKPEWGSGLSLTFWNIGSESARLWLFSSNGQGTFSDIALPSNLTFSHVLNALGLLPDGLGWDIILNAGEMFIIKSNEMKSSYMPISNQLSGGYAYVEDASQFWANQGDDYTAHGNVLVDAMPASSYEKKESVVFKYTAIDTVNNKLTWLPRSALCDHTGYIGNTASDGDCEIKQVYIPVWRYGESPFPHRGPFEQLLFPLLSTGDRAYNHAYYDKLPMWLSVSMNSLLVDTQSFLDADSAIGSLSLAQRQLYIIDKPVSFKELLLRECQLFGYALVWNNGKLRLKNMIAPAKDIVEMEVTESMRATVDEWPEMTMSTRTVLNRYEVHYDYDVKSGKYVSEPLVYTDMFSRGGLNTAKAITIKHPGIYVYSRAFVPIMAGELSTLFLGRIIRYPLPFVEITLSATMIQRCEVGDIVSFVSTRCYDPLGTGDFDCTVYATVTGRAWNYKTHTGRATLMLHAQYSNYGDPWAPSAVVQSFTPANLALKLEGLYWGSDGHPHDANIFGTGYKVNIIERSASNPASPESFIGVELSTGYSSSSNSVVLGTNIAAASPAYNSSKEYIMTYADYPTAISGQLTTATYQAGETNGVLGTTDTAQRYG